MNTAMNRKNPHLKSSGKEDKMIGFKDIYKMIGIIIVSFCAVFVCTLFLNYNLDLAGIKDQMAMEPLQSFYDALGFICAYLLMPKFYEMQNEKGLLPDIDIGFSPLLLFCPAGRFLQLPEIKTSHTGTFAGGKTIAMMKVFGYDEKDCSHVMLGGVPPFCIPGLRPWHRLPVRAVAHCCHCGVCRCGQCTGLPI